MYRTGYCCINLSLAEKFRTMQLGWARRNSVADVEARWQEVVKHNLTLLKQIIEWNINNKIYLYRISSDLIPLADHPEFGYMWRLYKKDIFGSNLRISLREIIKRARGLGARFTIHPSQYVSIGSPTEKVRENSRNNLEYHGELLDYLDLPINYDCPINIHVSNGTKDPEITAALVRESCDKMSHSVTKRLVFENEQSGCWTVENLRKYFPNKPITFDYHHYKINPGTLSLGEAIIMAKDSWPNNDPVQHYSEGRARDLDPAHSDMIKSLPTTPFDIEVEAKGKDLAIKDFLFDRNRLIGGVIY